MKKTLFLICLIFAQPIYAVEGDVRLLPLTGPAGTRQISPANGSATAYLMSFPGQKAICFQSAATTEVYIGTHSAISNTTGWGLFNKGESLCADLQGGTTIYFYGNGASSDIRIFFAR